MTQEEYNRLKQAEKLEKEIESINRVLGYLEETIITTSGVRISSTFNPGPAEEADSLLNTDKFREKLKAFVKDFLNEQLINDKSQFEKL